MRLAAKPVRCLHAFATKLLVSKHRANPQPVLEPSNNEAALTSEEYNSMLDPHDCDTLSIDNKAFLDWFGSINWNKPRRC